jgi:small subunit ribosomal protein S6
VSHYELIWIASPALPPEEVERMGQALENAARELGATLLKVERWGKKKLAYRVRKNDEGYYTYYLIEGGHAVVDELVRRIRMNEQIIKFLSVRVDLEALTRAANRRPPREAVTPDVPELEDEAGHGGY